MRIYIAGDSTAATASPDARPRAGWGEFIGAHFLPEVEIRNFATDNESSKLFINDNLLSAIKYDIQAGDFLLIQFGHNDQVPDEEKETTPFGSYQFYLRKYIDAAREVGATPVLLTPVSRGEFLDDGTVEQTLGNYPDACRQLGKKVGVTVLDLNQMTAHFYNILGAEETQKLFMHLPVGIHPNYPDGAFDNTHTNYDGARAIAELVAEAVKKSDSDLKKYLN